MRIGIMPLGQQVRRTTATPTASTNRRRTSRKSGSRWWRASLKSSSS